MTYHEFCLMSGFDEIVVYFYLALLKEKTSLVCQASLNSHSVQFSLISQSTICGGHVEKTSDSMGYRKPFPLFLSFVLFTFVSAGVNRKQELNPELEKLGRLYDDRPLSKKFYGANMNSWFTNLLSNSDNSADDLDEAVVETEFPEVERSERDLQNNEIDGGFYDPASLTAEEARKKAAAASDKSRAEQVQNEFVHSNGTANETNVTEQPSENSQMPDEIRNPEEELPLPFQSKPRPLPGFQPSFFWHPLFGYQPHSPPPVPMPDARAFMMRPPIFTPPEFPMRIARMYPPPPMNMMGPPSPPEDPEAIPNKGPNWKPSKSKPDPDAIPNKSG